MRPPTSTACRSGRQHRLKVPDVAWQSARCDWPQRWHLHVHAGPAGGDHEREWDYTGYCQTVNATTGLFNIGSPLTTALGTHDPTWVSNSKPGVGNGLGLATNADLEEVATAYPSTFTGTQYNGRMDADVTKKDRLSFIIYWAPNLTTSLNGAARPSNFQNAA